MSGFSCIECQSDKTGVVDSRPTQTGVRRRRQCQDCGQRFTTFETALRPDIRRLVARAGRLRKMANQIHEILDEIDDWRQELEGHAP